MEEYESKRRLWIIYFRGFPRSAALVSASILVAITLDPYLALFVAVSIWVLLSILNFVIGIILPNFVDLVIWQACLYVIMPIGTWIIKWPLTVTCTAVAALRGAPAPETFYIMAGILLVDITLSYLVRA